MTPELRVTSALHVWDVQVADVAVAQLVHSSGAILYHVAIPSIELRVGRTYAHGYDVTFFRSTVVLLLLILILQHKTIQRLVNRDRAVNFHRQQHFSATLLSEKRSWGNVFCERNAIDCQENIALAQVDAGLTQHSAAHVVPLVTLDNVFNAISTCFLIPDEIRAEVSSGVTTSRTARVTRRD